MSFAQLGSSARKARPAVAINTGSGRGVLHREPAPVAPARSSDGVPIRIVSRRAVEALVARLATEGVARDR